MTAPTINMPPEMARQVQATGLLTQDRLITIFEDALRQTRHAALFDTVRRNQAIGEELLSARRFKRKLLQPGGRALHENGERGGQGGNKNQFDLCITTLS